MLVRATEEGHALAELGCVIGSPRGGPFCREVMGWLRLGRQLTGALGSGAFTLPEGRVLVGRGRASCVSVAVDAFISQATPWEFALRSRRQVLCRERPNRGSCHTPSSAFSFQESPAAKDGHSRDATSASCVPGKEGRDSGDR